MKALNQNGFHLFFRISLIVTLLFVLSGLFQSCEKETEPLTTNSVIKGVASLYNAYDTPLQIKVTVSGPYGQNSSIAGEFGHYTLSGLGNGTYYLDYSMEGYGTQRLHGIQLFGNDTVILSNVILYKKVDQYDIPVFREFVTGFGLPGGYEGQYIAVETDAKADVPVLFFMDTKNSVSYKAYSYLNPGFNTTKNDQNEIVFWFTPGELPFESGQVVYVIAYICNPAEFYNNYIDTYHGIRQLSTLEIGKHSQVMSFTMP